MKAYLSISGFTLVEVVTSVAVVGILLSLAVPSFQHNLDKRRLTGAAEQLYGDLQYAHSAAILLNTPVFITFRNIGSGAAWCYGIDDSPSTVCDCSASPSQCTIGNSGGIEKTFKSADFRGVSITQTTFAANNGCVDPQRGIISSGTIPACSTSNAINKVSLHSATGTIKIAVTNLGRISLCSDDVSGYYKPVSGTC